MNPTTDSNAMADSESFLHNGYDVLMLVDAHAIIYRAYYAFPGLTTSTGLLVNAAFGFTRILLTAIRELAPTYLAVVFDHPKPTFRHEQFAEYKAHREKMPDDLQPQIAVVKEIVTALNMPRFEVSGYEADDLIGALTVQATQAVKSQQPHLKTVIVTGDRDLFQLVSDSVHVWLPGRGQHNDQEYDRQGVVDKMGVFPEQIVDLKALMGDSSDNIPGIKGIGPKTAVQLLQSFGSLEGIYQALAEQTKGLRPVEAPLKGSVVSKLDEGKESALMSQQLAQINTEAPITLDLEACRVSGYDKEQASELLRKLEFQSLINFLPPDELETGIQEALF